MNYYIDPKLEQDIQYVLDLLDSGRVQLARNYLQQTLNRLQLPQQDWNPGDPTDAA